MLLDILQPARILFGPGCSDRFGIEVSRLGKKPLIVTGQKSLAASGNLDRIVTPLRLVNIKPVFFAEVPSEPTVDIVDQAREIAADNQCDVVVGVGGGSTIDVAKAAAGLFYETHPTRDYLHGKEISSSRLPWMAVPTTAGSGSEVTENAVLIDPKDSKKASIRCEFWLPDTAIVDPIFTMSMPKRLTAITGLDALTHAIESFTSRWANPYSSALSQTAVVLVVQNIYSSYSTGKKEFREKMMLASLLAGQALNLSRSGAVHALAHPIGARYRISHGLVCAILLPRVMSYNLSLVDDKYASLAYAANLASPNTPPAEAALRLIHYVEKVLKKLELPTRLSEVGVKEEDIPWLVESSLSSSSLAANPRRTLPRDLTKILQESL